MRRGRIAVMCAVACGRSISRVLSAHHRGCSARAPSAACFLPLSNPLSVTPVVRRGKHGGKGYGGKRVAATARSCDDITANIPKARVAQRSDANDEWLEGALFRRSSKSHHPNQPAPIFNTASAVAEYFLADVVGDSAGRPLRRVARDEDAEELHWSEQMFAPLFGGDHTTSTNPTQSSVAKGSPKQGKRTNLKITLAYRGRDFCGWEDQRHELYRTEHHGNRKLAEDRDAPSAKDAQTLPSVQGTLVDVLDPLLCDASIDAEANGQQTRGRPRKPIVIKVAGRTDAGVSAISQVCRIRTWRTIEGIEACVQDAVNKHATGIGGGLRISDVECVGDEFHPTFGATSRVYAYIIDLEDGSKERTGSSQPAIPAHLVPRVDLMLRALEGKELDYIALSYGKVKTKTTLCTLHRARAEIVALTQSRDSGAKQAVCIQLVGDRFLRRMVRILVATALREANRGDACQDALLDILQTKDRRYRAKAAPPDGLVFIGARYRDAE